MDVLRTVNITRGNDEKFQQITDKVIREYSLTIIFNQQELVTLLCSPMHVDELAVGYIYNEGLIRDRDDISKIEYIDNNICITTSNETAITLKKQHKIITVSSGTILSKPNIKSLPVNTSTNKVLYSEIYQMADILTKSSKLFDDTGGVHSALLSSCDIEFTVFREDIGRHNAVDKILGFMILNNITPEKKVLITSGRVSSEILLKIARSEIPVLVSRSAPTDVAIDLADKLGITLIGFVRGKRMNIYTHVERIQL